MKINYVSLCSGYGAECVAFKRLQRTFPDFDFELLAWSEYDPDNPKPVDFQPAVMAHNALHPESAHLNLGNLITADWGGGLRVQADRELILCLLQRHVNR